MKKLLLLAGLLCIALTSWCQISVSSSTATISTYSESAAKYVEKRTVETRNYITWKEGQLTIICPTCSTSKIVFTVTKNNGKTVMSKEFYVEEYALMAIPSGERVTATVGYRNGYLYNIGMSDGETLIIYGGFEDY